MSEGRVRQVADEADAMPLREARVHPETEQPGWGHFTVDQKRRAVALTPRGMELVLRKLRTPPALSRTPLPCGPWLGAHAPRLSSAQALRRHGGCGACGACGSAGRARRAAGATPAAARCASPACSRRRGGRGALPGRRGGAARAGAGGLVGGGGHVLGRARAQRAARARALPARRALHRARRRGPHRGHEHRPRAAHLALDGRHAPGAAAPGS